MFGYNKRIKELERKVYRLEERLNSQSEVLEFETKKIRNTLKIEFEKTNKPAYKCGQKIWANIYVYRQYSLKEVTVIKSYADFSCDGSLGLMYKVIDSFNVEYTTHPVNMYKTKPKDKCKC